MPSSDDKVFVVIQGIYLGNDGTSSWPLVSAQYIILASDNNLVPLAPIGGDTGAVAAPLDFGDSSQDIQRKMAEKIKSDFNRTDLRFEFLGG